jgi:hypothetical protein
MIDHDENVGTVLNALDDAGIADKHLCHVRHPQRCCRVICVGIGLVRSPGGQVLD